MGRALPADELEAHNAPRVLGVLLERPREALQRAHLDLSTEVSPSLPHPCIHETADRILLEGLVGATCEFSKTESA